MPSDLARFGQDWTAMTDAAADWSAALLRRTAAVMRGDLDAVAMADIERGTAWQHSRRRDPQQGER